MLQSVQASTQILIAYGKEWDAVMALVGDKVSYAYGISSGLYISMSGTVKDLAAVWHALRSLGYATTYAEETEEKVSEKDYTFTKEGTVDVILRFYSTVCVRVQVGTKTVDEPVYEIQCLEQSAPIAA